MPNLPPGFAVEIDFPSGADETLFIFDDSERGQFDTGGVFGGAESFADVTDFVRSGSIDRGAPNIQEPFARADVGRCVLILDNRDARFDPSNLSGPFVGGGVTQVQPMRQVRVRDGGTILFRGFAEDWALSYPERGKDAIVTLTAVDGIDVIANFDGREQTLQGDGESTGSRINRILVNAGWDPIDTVLEAGDEVVQGTTLATPAWQECQLVSDTEIGQLYMDAAGRINFKGRSSFLADTTPLQIFGDDPGAGELPFTDFEYSFANEDIKNFISIARAGGTAQIAEDTDSQEDFLKRSLTRTDFLYREDGASRRAAEYLLDLLARPRLRIRSITIRPDSDPATLYPAVLPLDFGDRIQVRFTPPGGPGVTERDGWVRGIAHRFTPATWETTFVLQDAEQEEFNAALFMEFDDANTGRFDTGEFGVP